MQFLVWYIGAKSSFVYIWVTGHHTKWINYTIIFKMKQRLVPQSFCTHLDSKLPPLWCYLTYLLLQIILSVSKSNLTEQLLPRNRWRLYCSKMALGASLSRNSNWLHVSLLLLIHSERRCMSVASRSLKEQYRQVRRKIKYICIVYIWWRQIWRPQRFW